MNISYHDIYKSYYVEFFLDDILHSTSQLDRILPVLPRDAVKYQVVLLVHVEIVQLLLYPLQQTPRHLQLLIEVRHCLLQSSQLTLVTFFLLSRGSMQVGQLNF